MQVTDADNKVNSTSSAIVNGIKDLCKCRFVRDRITGETFWCGSSEPMVSNIVVYGATIHGTATTNSSELLSYIEEWLTDNTTVNILGRVLTFVKPITEECCTEMTVTEKAGATSTLNITSDSDYTLFIVIGGSSSAGVIVIITIIVIMTITVTVICKHQKEGKIRYGLVKIFA